MNGYCLPPPRDHRASVPFDWESRTRTLVRIVILNFQLLQRPVHCARARSAHNRRYRYVPVLALTLGVLAPVNAHAADTATPPTPPADVAAVPEDPPPSGPTQDEQQVVAIEVDATGGSVIEVDASGGDDVSGDGMGDPIEVVVADTPIRRAAGAAQVIGEAELERFEYDDVHAVLSQVPGVYVRTEDGMGLRPNIGLRGVNPERSKKVTLLEDGVLLGPAPYSAPAAYFFPLMTRMSAVRVIKGPAAVSYGPQTVAGTIDLVSRFIPGTPTLGLDFSLGQHDAYKTHVYAGTSDEQLGVLIEGVHLENSGFKVLPNRSDTGFSRNEWVIKGSYDFDPLAEDRQQLRIKLSYADEVSNETYLGLSEADFARDPNLRYGASDLDQMTNYRTSVVLTHEFEAASGLRLQTDAYRHDYERTWRKVNGFRGVNLFNVLTDDTPRSALYRALLTGESDATSSETLLIGPNQRQFVSQGIQSRVHGSWSTGALHHKIEAGVRYHYDHIARRHSEDGFLLIGGEPYPDGSSTSVTAFNRAHTHALAAHVVDAISWGDLTLTPGVRAEFIRSSFQDQMSDSTSHRFLAVVLPGTGAFYSLTPSLGVLAGAYRGFSPPPPGSDSEILPESSWNLEAGARYTGTDLSFEAIGFYNAYGNLTDVCTFATGCTGDDVDRQFDAGEARIFGAESLVKYTLRSGAFSFPLAANYTFTHGEFAGSFTSEDPIFGRVENGDQMPYLPPHQWRASAALEHPNASAYVAATYVSAMREVASSEPIEDVLSTQSLLTLDVGATLSMGQPFALYTNIYNLLDEQRIVAHRPFGARPNAPRWVHVGLKAKF